MEKERKKGKTLMTKFIVIFIVYSLISIVLSTVFVFIIQTNSYKSTYKTNLQKIGTFLSNEICEDSTDFSNLLIYYKDNKDDIRIPIDYDDNPEPYRQAAEQLFEEKYPGTAFDSETDFAALDKDVQQAYATYYFAKFLAVFENAMNSFDYGETYFLYPTEEKDTMCYMIDFIREPETVDGEEYIDIGIEAYEDPAIYVNMWKTMETGAATGELDTFDTAYARSYAYFTPVVINGETAGIIGSEAEMSIVGTDINKSVLRLALLLLVIMLLGTAVIASIVRKILIDRIIKLAGSVGRYADEKDPEISDEIMNSLSSDDELSALSETVASMIIEIDEYMREVQAITAEKEKVAAELKVATRIQASSLPNPDEFLQENKGFSLYASMDPAKEVGGDFYDFYMIDDDHLALTIADVSGKGVPAALFMMESKMLLKNSAKLNVSPKDVLQIVNNQLCENNEAEMFVTVWLGILEISTGKLTAANAGHEYPAIRKANGEFELYTDKHGFVLAGFEGVKYTDYVIQLEKGDSIFVYTDGVAESTDAANELFGTDRMIMSLNEDLNADCRTRLENMRKSVDAFIKEAPQFDDLTMLTLDYTGR